MRKISDKLKEDIIKFSKGFGKPCYLELGLGEFPTIVDVSNSFLSLYGVEPNNDLFLKANKQLLESKIKKAIIFCGDSSRVPFNRYDVILIKSSNSKSQVLLDTYNILKKNISEKPFIIVYYHYDDVNSGSRTFCDEFLSEYLVPVGEASEAAACAFDNIMKKKYINLFGIKLGISK